VTRRFDARLVILALGTAVAVAFASALIIANGQAPSLGSGGYRITVLVPSAEALGPGGSVRIAGLRVGRVTALHRHGVGAAVDLDIDKSQGPLPVDSQFDVRLRSFVGENYVEIFPGRSKTTIPGGGELPMSHIRDEYVDVEQVLDSLRPPTRDHVRRLLQRFGGGLRGRGTQLNATLGSLAGLINQGAPVIRLLDQDRAQTARLIDESGRVAQAIADRGTAIGELARAGTTTFQAISDRNQALRAMLDNLPAALRQVRDTSQTLRAVTAQAAPVVANLAGAVNDLHPTLSRIVPAARVGKSLFDELRAAAPRLQSTLRRVQRVAPSSVQALPDLHKALCEALPALEFIVPYADIPSNFIENLGSANAYYDAQGHAMRLAPLIGENSFGMYTPQLDQAVKTLLSAGILSKVHEIGYNPYPLRSDLGNGGSTYGKGFTGPTDWGNGPRKYPHVLPEC
jgi:phospholipid/cholesterol/gamma-HCH transport system substrate-binding protein